MQRDTLRKLLSTLVDDCGYDAVRKSVEALNPEAASACASRGAIDKRRGRPRAKMTAVAVVDSLGISDAEKKEALMVLAHKYDAKEFMPNINYIRAFVEREGVDVSCVRSRQQATHTVFRNLGNWETRKLQELETRGAYGRPKSLSVIAGAIESVGRQNRL